jgi:hypothetical protein
LSEWLCALFLKSLATLSFCGGNQMSQICVPGTDVIYFKINSPKYMAKKIDIVLFLCFCDYGRFWILHKVSGMLPSCNPNQCRQIAVVKTSAQKSHFTLIKCKMRFFKAITLMQTIIILVLRPGIRVTRWVCEKSPNFFVRIKT